MKKLSILIITCAIAACGYKGPLYLPNNQPAPPNPGNNQFAPKANQVESNIVNSDLPRSTESATFESAAIESKNNTITK